MKLSQNKHRKGLRFVLISIAILLIAAAGYVAYAFMSKSWPFAESSTEGSDSSTVNYNPPTQADTDASQDAKKRIAAEEDTEKSASDDSSSSNSSKKTVGVGVTYADIYNDNLEIRAFTNGVIEGTGTCTATATMKDMPSMVITKSSEAFVDVSSSQCNPIYIPVSQLKSGTWEVVVKFSSPDSEGSSGAVEVKVP